MNASPQEFTQLGAYIRASRELNQWISGARALALMSAALDSGVLDALRSGAAPEQIAHVTNLDLRLVMDLCLALETHGVILRDGESYRLAPDLALLASQTAAIPLASVIRQAMVMMRTLQTIATPAASYATLPVEDILAMAEGAGISALSASPHVSAVAAGMAMPEVQAVWQAGAHHLEVGCGVGNSLLGIVTTYPKVTAVGIEIDEQTAREAERRANLLGIADRVKVRRMDACDLQDEDRYDTIQWSQFFFPAGSRPVVLEAMRRALKPGGYLFMPWLGSSSSEVSPHRGEMGRMLLRALRSGDVSFLSYLNDILGDTPGRRKKERRFAAIQRLLFSQWGVPVRSVDELWSEIAGCGFKVLRIIHTAVNQFALTRGFLLAQREAAEVR